VPTGFLRQIHNYHVREMKGALDITLERREKQKSIKEIPDIV
jgi:hypothetical protein